MPEDKHVKHTAPLSTKILTAGTSACIADTLTYPFDTIKVRLQLQNQQGNVQIPLNTTAGEIIANKSGPSPPPRPVYRGLSGTALTLIRTEGPLSLYTGLSAGLQRQLLFSSVRLGCYDTVKDFYNRLFRLDVDGLHIGTRILAGATTGALAVAMAQPTDLVKIKFQGGQGKKDYSSTIGAYRSIYRTSGMKGLWKGCVPNMARNAICNVSEIVTYDVSKDLLLLYTSLEDNIYCHFTAGCVAGFVAAFVSSPVDVVKTRYMNDSRGIYTNALNCAIRMGREEGFQAFYKGFFPSFVRIFMFNVFLWVIYEQAQSIMYDKPKDV